MTENHFLHEENKSVPDLTIVVVNWNTRELLLQCLRSISAASLTQYSDLPNRFTDAASLTAQQQLIVEVIVVDNGSSDGSVGAVRQQFPAVRIIENKENVGFARANNQAIVASSGRFVLLLNSDTEVMPGALFRLYQFMEAHPHVAGAGARILNADGSLQRSCFRFPTVGREFWYLFYLDLVWPYAVYEMDHWQQDAAAVAALRENTGRSVDVLLGACLLLRRRALDEVGLLDESFFMYSEEVDLCYRLHRAGWRLCWVPGAEVVHYGGQSTKQMAPEMFLQLYRSKVLYFHKHYGARTAQLYKLVLLLAAIPRVLMPMLHRLLPSRQRSQKVGGNYRRLIAALPNL